MLSRGWRWSMALVLASAGLTAGVLDDTRPPHRATGRSVVERSHRPPPLGLVLRHNVPVLAIAASGLVTFGVSSVAALAQVGLQAGRLFIETRHLPPWLAAASTVPHGIPEFAAFLLAGVAGLSGGSFALAFAAGDYLECRRTFQRGCTSCAAAAALLVCAACIERWVTPLLIQAAATAAGW